MLHHYNLSSSLASTKIGTYGLCATKNLNSQVVMSEAKTLLKKMSCKAMISSPAKVFSFTSTLGTDVGQTEGNGAC